MKEKIKNTKGITLVALIITIIVLLILAVVGITSINNNKILEYAKNGRDAYNQGKTNETETISSYESYINDNVPNAGKGGDEDVDFYKLFVENKDYAQNRKEYGMVFTAENKMYDLRLDYGQINTDESEYYTYSVKSREEYKTELEEFNAKFTDETEKVKIDEVKYVIMNSDGSFEGVIGKSGNEVYFARCRYNEEDSSKSGTSYYYETNVDISTLGLDSVPQGK